MTTTPDAFTIALTTEAIAAMPRPVAAWLAAEIARDSRAGKPTTVSMPMFLALLDRKAATTIKPRRAKQKPTT